ncbi:sirohydrochlorin cobaltochelatase, partial [bacterium]
MADGAVLKKGVLLLGHGSKLKEANDTLRQVAKAVEAGFDNTPVEAGFLQIESPDFQQAFDTLAQRGANDVIVMPYFLYSGLHVTKDLPEE